MAKTSLSDLRGHLFETIERLMANDDVGASQCERIDPENAKLIIDASKAIVESAKAEFTGIKTMNDLTLDLRKQFTKNSPLGLKEGEN